ncbi:hypothetical protein AB1462_14130 [Pseudomonas sp. SB113]|uniref:hypothetical protein n=1 Tax=Pseudomonas sp. SB113 TaxID=3154123 RepID=UPI00345CC0F7
MDKVTDCDRSVTTLTCGGCTGSAAAFSLLHPLSIVAKAMAITKAGKTGLNNIEHLEHSAGKKGENVCKLPQHSLKQPLMAVEKVLEQVAQDARCDVTFIGLA